MDVWRKKQIDILRIKKPRSLTKKSHSVISPLPLQVGANKSSVSEDRSLPDASVGKLLLNSLPDGEGIDGLYALLSELLLQRALEVWRSADHGTVCAMVGGNLGDTPCTTAHLRSRRNLIESDEVHDFLPRFGRKLHNPLFGGPRMLGKVDDPAQGFVFHFLSPPLFSARGSRLPPTEANTLLIAGKKRKAQQVPFS